MFFCSSPAAPSTVSQVMGDFHQRVEDLRTVARIQDAEASRLGQIIEDARNAMTAATNEASHARATADRLEAAYTTPAAITVAELKQKTE